MSELYAAPSRHDGAADPDASHAGIAGATAVATNSAEDAIARAAAVADTVARTAVEQADSKKQKNKKIKEMK